jgi:hypothetical protein
VNPILRFLRRPWSGVAHARHELEKSQAERSKVRELGDDLRAIDRENHIAGKVHRLARGGKA